jgi:hypothetical protein
MQMFTIIGLQQQRSKFSCAIDTASVCRYRLSFLQSTSGDDPR